MHALYIMLHRIESSHPPPPLARRLPEQTDLAHARRLLRRLLPALLQALHKLHKLRLLLLLLSSLLLLRVL